VRLIAPPSVNRPVVGNHVGMPPVLTTPQSETLGVISPGAQTNGPHIIIGFPHRGIEKDPINVGDSGVLSFSGQGHEIWQNSTTSAPEADSNHQISAGRAFIDDGRPGPTNTESFHFQPRPPIRVRPVLPVFPILGLPVFGLGFGFGGPGFGLGLGFNSFGGPTCGAFWGWGYGCNTLPFYDYGYGNYGYSASDNLEGQIENQNGPMIYENSPARGSAYVYDDEKRELVQLYLKDGTVYNVTDYWLVNDQLHFTTLDAGGTQSVEHAVDFDQLDLQRTIDVNTQRGFRFVLRNEPLEEYLREHPDAGAAVPQTGPAGPLPPPAQQQPAYPEGAPRP